MLDRLSALQRHCLAALEVECLVWRQDPGADSRAPAAGASVPEGSSPAESAARPGLRLVVADASEAASSLARALAKVLGAELIVAGEDAGAAATLVSVGQAATAAALSLPELAVLRADPRAKRRSWLKIRSFLSLRRHSHPA